MNNTDDILIKPAWIYAVFKALPLMLFAVGFLITAWYISPYFIFFSLASALGAWYRLLYTRNFKYLITAEYIRFTYGILFKRTDQLEMFRVKDYIITQPFTFQIFKLMNLVLKSTDIENPTICLRGIRECNILDMIRERVQIARKNNNIYELN